MDLLLLRLNQVPLAELAAVAAIRCGRGGPWMRFRSVARSSVERVVSLRADMRGASTFGGASGSQGDVPERFPSSTRASAADEEGAEDCSLEGTIRNSRHSSDQGYPVPWSRYSSNRYRVTFFNRTFGSLGWDLKATDNVNVCDASCFSTRDYTSHCFEKNTREGGKLLGSIPRYVKIVEVGPRDGLQNEKDIVPTRVKVELIKMLVSSGLPAVETTSFVLPNWVPQLGDAKDVMEAIRNVEGARFPCINS